MSNTIITIGRTFGSLGSKVGKLVAEKLNIAYYDKELLTLAAKESGISEDLLQDVDEKPVNSFLYSIVTHGMSAYTSPLQYNNLTLNDRVYKAQSDIIKKIADTEPAVIVGRCADDILGNRDNVLKIFFYAERDLRIKRMAEIIGCSEKEAAELVKKTDKVRKSYYEFFTNKPWADFLNFDLCINSGIGVEKCVDIVMEYVRIMEGKNK